MPQKKRGVFIDKNMSVVRGTESPQEMTPNHRSIIREGWQALGLKGSAANANPFTKKGVVAASMQDWIAKNYPVEAAEMRFDANPEGLTNDAQCVIDGTVDPNEVLDAVLQNLFEFNGKFAKHLIAQENAARNQRIETGKASLTEMMQLQVDGDPRGDAMQAELQKKQAAHKQNRKNLAVGERMQSRERAQQELKAQAMKSGNFF